MREVITQPAKASGGLGTFERYLSLWVGLCMVAGILIGKLLPAAVASLRGIQFGEGSQINAPIAVLIWLMITPMMMKVNFSSVRNVGKRPTGLLVTLFINWLVKPFSMALLAWVFFRIVFAGLISSAEADQYIAGCIILAAAPCTAMVFVWSHLTNGDAAYTLVQVSVNDLIMLVLFVPIVQFLVHGASSLTVPFKVLLVSVVVFIVIPLLTGALLRAWLLRPGSDRSSARSGLAQGRRALLAAGAVGQRAEGPGGGARWQLLGSSTKCKNLDVVLRLFWGFDDHVWRHLVATERHPRFFRAELFLDGSGCCSSIPGRGRRDGVGGNAFGPDW